MRCLMIVPSLRRAGAETQVVALANGLAELGHEIHLLTFERHLDLCNRLLPVVWHHTCRRRWKYDFGYTHEIARIIDREGIEVIHTTLQFALLAGWLGRMQSTRKPPLVASLHTTISRNRKEDRQVRWFYRQLLRRCASIIFVCENQRDYWVHRFPELMPISKVVHNGIPLHHYDPQSWKEVGRRLRDELCIPAAATVFGCLAGFRPEKAHHLLIDAFSHLAGEPYLILAGDGPLRKAISNLVIERSVARRVHFLGEVSDCRQVIAASTATVLSSITVETFSMAMLESMAMGVPMIAPAIGGLAEAIEDGESGLIYPPGDEGALSRSMSCITDEPAQVEVMGKHARAVIMLRFSEDKMVGKTEGILAGVIAQAR